nr:MAG TPA: hypothetical protein [Caudoviricetes sp.]
MNIRITLKFILKNRLDRLLIQSRSLALMIRLRLMKTI